MSERKKRVMRKPTGNPSWPVLLLAGREKAGKTYSAAQASASDLIDRTFWISFGEKDPDEYGAIPGVRFEIVEHDGSLEDMRDAIKDALAEQAGSDKPHMLVIDSVSRIWDAIRNKATADAVARGKYDRNGELIIGMDLWNKANAGWMSILNLARQWNGPVLFTARMDTVTVMDDRGLPTKQKTEKVKGQKSLPYDVDGIVEMPERGTSILVGARSVIYQIPERAEIKDFTVDGLWRKLGLDRTLTELPAYTEPPEPTPAEAPQKISLPA